MDQKNQKVYMYGKSTTVVMTENEGKQDQAQIHTKQWLCQIYRDTFRITVGYDFLYFVFFAEDLAFTAAVLLGPLLSATKPFLYYCTYTKVLI